MTERSEFSVKLTARELRKKTSHLEKRARTALKRRNHSESADLWSQAAVLRHQHSDYAGAVSAWLEIMRLYPGNTPERRQALAVAFTNMGSAYRAQGNIEKAEDAFSRSLSIHDHIGPVTNAVIDRFNLAMLACEQANYPEALGLLQQAAAFAREESITVWEQLALNYCGWIYNKICAFESALEMFHQLSELGAEKKDLVAFIHGMLGQVESYRRTGYLLYAYQALQDLKDITKEIEGGAVKAEILLERSDYFFSLGDIDEARNDAMEVKKIGERNLPEGLLIRLHERIGRLDAERRIMASSRKHFERALDLAERTRNRNARARLLVDFMTLDFMEKKTRETIARSQTAEQAILEVSDRNLHAWYALLMGRVLQSKGDNEQAFSYRRFAVDLAEETREPELMWRAYFHLGRLLETAGEMLNARNNYIAAYDLIREVADNLRSDQYPTLRSCYLTYYRRLKVEKHLIKFLYQSGEKDEAREYYDQCESEELKRSLRSLFEE